MLRDKVPMYFAVIAYIDIQLTLEQGRGLRLLTPKQLNIHVKLLTPQKLICRCPSVSARN